MNNQMTFEYFSTFAPVSDTFIVASHRHKKIETDAELFPLQWMGNSYTIYPRANCKKKDPTRSR